MRINYLRPGQNKCKPSNEEIKREFPARALQYMQNKTWKMRTAVRERCSRGRSPDELLETQLQQPHKKRHSAGLNFYSFPACRMTLIPTWIVE